MKTVADDYFGALLYARSSLHSLMDTILVGKRDTYMRSYGLQWEIARAVCSDGIVRTFRPHYGKDGEDHFNENFDRPRFIAVTRINGKRIYGVVNAYPSGRILFSEIPSSGQPRVIGDQKSFSPDRWFSLFACCATSTR